MELLYPIYDESDGAQAEASSSHDQFYSVESEIHASKESNHVDPDELKN